MRFWSTPQSTQAGEVTVLAIVETVAATAFSIWLVVHRGTLTHVVVGACIAPFLLLRTNESTKLAFGWGRSLDAFVDRVEGSRFGEGLLAFATFLLLLFGRSVSIALVAFRRPFYSVRAISQNWTRIVLATDVHHPPELLPEIETTPTEELGIVELFQFSKYFKTVSKIGREELQTRNLWQLVITIIGYPVIAIIFFVPALAYRYSLKATAIVYLPLLWVLHDSHVDGSTMGHKLEDITESQIERLKRWYSGFVIVFLVVVPAIVSLTLHDWWQELSRWLQRAHPAIIALLSAFLPASPSGLHLEGWHVARGINAALTLVLFFWADGKLRQMQRGISQNSRAMVAGLNLWLLVRGLLTLYIIGCTLYIVIQAVDWRSMWPFQIKWFPH